jgi:fucose permease
MFHWTYRTAGGFDGNMTIPPMTQTTYSLDRIAQRGSRPGMFPALGTFFLIGIVQSSIGPLLPLFEHRLDATAAASSLITTFFFGGSLGTMLIISFAHLPERTTLPWGIGGFAVGSFGMLLSHTLWVSVGASLVIGISTGAVVLGVNSVFSRQERGVALINLVNGCFALGTVAGPLLASFSLSRGAPYGFSVCGIGAVLCLRTRAVADWPVRSSRSADDAPEAAKAPMRLNIRFPALYLLYGGVEAAIGTWGAVNLAGHGMAASTAAVGMALFWAATAVSKFAAPLLIRRLTVFTIVAGGLVGSTVGLLVVSVGSGIVGYVIAGLFLGPVFPTGLAWIAHATDDRRLTGLASSADMTGSIIFPTAIGWLISAKDSPAVPGLLAAISMAAAAISFWIRRVTDSGVDRVDAQ